MAVAVEWKFNDQLKADLLKYVEQNLKRSEIVDYMKRDYPQYPWTVPTLARRLDHFQIGYIDKNINIDDVIEVVRSELEGPGNSLGYRAMHLKVRTEYHLRVPRQLVSDVMYDLDPEGVGSRNVKKKKKNQNDLLFLKGQAGRIPLMGTINLWDFKIQPSLLQSMVALILFLEKLFS